MWKEFVLFLKEYKIVSLALAFIMGAASTDLVKSLVDNVIMPIVSILFFEQNLKAAAWQVGPITLKWGIFLSDFLSFMILAFVVFLIAKKILKEEKVAKK